MTARGKINLVERACTDLAHEGRPVTIVAIAAATGLSRSTIYRSTELRSIVEHHKHPETPMASLTDELATLRTAVNSLAEQVRRHDEQLRRMRR